LLRKVINLCSKKLSVSIAPEHYGTLTTRGHVRVAGNLVIGNSIRALSNAGFIPDIIVEAVPENMESKFKVFEEIEAVFGENVIIGSNTSTLPLQTMADHLKYPSRFVGIHYNHPAHIIPIVEVTKLLKTSDEVVNKIVDILKKCGKIPITLLKPIDGFITNRLQHAMYREIYALMEDGGVGAQDVDNVAKYMFGPRMCVTGLLLQKDCSGLDTHAVAQTEMVKVLANNTTISKALQDKSLKGNYGLKSGQGWYDWKGTGDPVQFQQDINTRLERVYQFLTQNKVIYDAPPPVKARL